MLDICRAMCSEKSRAFGRVFTVPYIRQPWLNLKEKLYSQHGVEELGRERVRNEGGVSKREKMVKSWIKRVVTVIVVI